jgi:DNA-directed RNA polymerase specialized sigma24 family protein
VDDIVQDVMTAFWKAKEFTYDPSKGRFRSWLKTCTVRAAIRLKGKALKLGGVSLQDIPLVDVAVEPVWNDVWEAQLVSLALDQLRRVYGSTVAFKAFEQYALFDRPAEEVAAELQTSVDNVYQAKARMTANLRKLLRHIRELDE